MKASAIDRGVALVSATEASVAERQPSSESLGFLRPETIEDGMSVICPQCERATVEDFGRSDFVRTSRSTR